VVVKDNRRLLLAEEDGWEVGRDCNSSAACKSEWLCIRGALCREMSKYPSAPCLGMTSVLVWAGIELIFLPVAGGTTTRLSFTQEHFNVNIEEREAFN